MHALRPRKREEKSLLLLLFLIYFKNNHKQVVKQLTYDQMDDLGLLGLRSTNSENSPKFNCNLAYPDLQVGQLRGRIVGGAPCFRKLLINEPRIHLGKAFQPLS